jgi:hypothetical protein
MLPIVPVRAPKGSAVRTSEAPPTGGRGWTPSQTRTGIPLGVMLIGSPRRRLVSLKVEQKKFTNATLEPNFPVCRYDACVSI